MARGKQTCKILKDIRRQIAEANDIEFITSECRYKGDCLGTCPKCEAEVRYLEQQLRARTLAGKAVTLAGISAASLAMLMPVISHSQTPADISFASVDSLTTTRADSIIIKGIVKSQYTTENDSVETEEVSGARILNLTTGEDTITDLDGKFEINVCKGDSIEVTDIGFFPKRICVSDLSEPITIVLEEDQAILDEVIVTGWFGPPKELPSGMLDLFIVDEKGNQIDPYDVYIYRLYIDEDGDEDEIHLHPINIKDDTALRLYWNEDSDFIDEISGKRLKEAILRIEVDGYEDPVIIKVKYPKLNAKKTIKFKRKKK